MPVDSKLHDEGSSADRSSEEPKRGIKGAAGGIFIGSRTTPNKTTDYRGGVGPLTGDAGIDGTRTVQGQTGVPGDHRAVLDQDDALGQDGRGTMDATSSIGVLATFTVADSVTASRIAATPANAGGTCEVLVFVDAGGGVDGAFVGKDDLDANGVAQDINLVTAPGNYAVYARRLSADGAIGPFFRTRRTVTVV